MIFAHSLVTCPALLSVPLLSRVVFGAAKPIHADPCVKVAGQDFVDPANAIACQKSFSFNETIRQNVLSVISRVFDFCTFEDF